MNKALGIALLVVGAVLVGYGINASESIGSDISRFRHTPPDKSIWLLLSGMIVGLFLSLGRTSEAALSGEGPRWQEAAAGISRPAQR